MIIVGNSFLTEGEGGGERRRGGGRNVWAGGLIA